MTSPYTASSRHQDQFLHRMARFGLVTSLLSACGFIVLITFAMTGDGPPPVRTAFFFSSIGLGIIGQIAQDIVIVPRLFSRIPWRDRLPLTLLLLPALNLATLFYLLSVEFIRLVRRRSAAHRVLEATLEGGAEIPANFAHLPVAGTMSSVSAALSPATILLPIVVAIANIGGVSAATVSPAILSPGSGPHVTQVTPSPTVSLIATLTPAPTAVPSPTPLSTATSTIATRVPPTATSHPTPTFTPTPTATPPPLNVPFSAIIGTWLGPGVQVGDTACARIIIQGGSSSAVIARYNQYLCSQGPDSEASEPASGTYSANHLSLSVPPPFCASGTVDLEFDLQSTTTMTGHATGACEGSNNLLWSLTLQ